MSWIRDAVRTHPRATVAATGSSAVLVVLVVAALVAGGGGHQVLSIGEPTPSDSASPSIEPSPTDSGAAPSATDQPTDVPTVGQGQPNGTETTPSETTSPSPEPAVTSFGPEGRLSDAYLDRVFGQGGNALRQQHTDGGPAWSCVHGFQGWAWTWAWSVAGSGEVVAGEVLATETTVAKAADDLDACRQILHERATSGGTYVVIPIGDEAFVVKNTFPLYTEVHAVTRLSHYVVVLSWIQSGPVADTEPATRALRDALAKVVTGDEATPPRSAPAPQPPAEVHGLLSRLDLPDEWPALLDWERDRLLLDTSVHCGGGAVTPMDTVDRPVRREFHGGEYAEPDSYVLHVTRGHASDAATAHDEFAACRTNLGKEEQLTDVAGIGDEAFREPTAAPGGIACLYTRSGATLFELCMSMQTDNALEATAKIAVARDGA